MKFSSLIVLSLITCFTYVRAEIDWDYVWEAVCVDGGSLIGPFSASCNKIKKIWDARVNGHEVKTQLIKHGQCETVELSQNWMTEICGVKGKHIYFYPGDLWIHGFYNFNDITGTHYECVRVKYGPAPITGKVNAKANREFCSDRKSGNAKYTYEDLNKVGIGYISAPQYLATELNYLAACGLQSKGIDASKFNSKTCTEKEALYKRHWELDNQNKSYRINYYKSGKKCTLTPNNSSGARIYENCPITSSNTESETKIELKCNVDSYECKRCLRKLPDVKWIAKSNGWTTSLSSGTVNKYCNTSNCMIAYNDKKSKSSRQSY